MNDKEFINVFGEDKNNDYIHRLLNISDKIQTTDNIIIRTSKIAANEHIVLSITDSDGNLIPVLYDSITNTSITEGEVLLDSKLFKVLQKLTLYRTDTLISENISVWKIQ